MVPRYFQLQIDRRLWLIHLLLSHLLIQIHCQMCSVENQPCYQKLANFEVRAVLVSCHPLPHHGRCHCGQAGKLQGIDSYICEQGKLKDCDKKIIVTVKMASLGPRNVDPEFVVIDDVYDCQTDTKQKLLYPYVLKIKQEPLLQTYRLNCEGVVREKNSEMEGQGSRKRKQGRRLFNSPNFKRKPLVNCNDRVTHTLQKIKRQAEEVYKEDKTEYDYLSPVGGTGDIDRVANLKENNERVKRISLFSKNSAPFGIDGKRNIPSSAELPMEPPESMAFNHFGREKSPHIPTPSENCHEYDPLYNMKYFVYRLDEPVVKHHFSVEIFEKHSDINACTQWTVLTEGEPIYLGTYDTEFSDKNKSVVASYSSREPPLREFSLPYDILRLVIPQFPSLRGGPEKFLVIPESMFIRKKDCFGSSGVDYGAHERYTTKCNSMRYPPKCFWSSDTDREAAGNRGFFFLKYFAKLPQSPLHNTTDSFENLTFFYEGPHQSVMNIEIKADFNIMLKPHASAAITEVYVDATNGEKTDVTVKVTNTGLVYSVFYVYLTECPLRLPAGISNIATSSAVIPPQHQHIFSITVLLPLPKGKFFCSIDVKNYRHDIIAFRRIRFQKNDRCICIWHCCCTCLETDNGLKCQPLPIDHYNAAGFFGGLPMTSKYIMSTSFVEEYVMLLFNLCLTMTLLLLFMGLTKAVLGIFFPYIGGFGLGWYIDLPKSIDHYYESNLRDIPVQYDKLGWPVHPETRRRCRSTSISAEFSINIVFFLLYPLVLIHAVVIRICSSQYTNEKLDSSRNHDRNMYRSRRRSFSPPTSPKSSRRRFNYKPPHR